MTTPFRFTSTCLLLATLLVTATTAPVLAQHGSGPDPTDRGKPPSPGARIIEKFRYPAMHWDVPRVGRDVRRVVLPNGIIVYLKHDRSLPVVNVSVQVRTGSIYEKREQHGVAALTGMVMRSGGTETLAPEELDRKLEMMSAEISTSIGLEEGAASLDVMSRDLDEGLRLLADVVMRPRFDPTRLSLALDQMHEGLRRQNDDPGGIARREFNKRIYGTHPYGWDYDWKVLQGIRREDLVAWHRQYFHPDSAFPFPGRPDQIRPNVMIAASGDFDTDAMVARLTRLFGSWQVSPVNPPAVAAVEDVPHPGVFLVRKDATQSRILAGHLTANRYTPDRIPIAIMNYILGGGSFNSRVVEKIRNDEGLAYSVSTTFSINYRDHGPFYGALNTRSAATCKALGLLIAEIRRMKDGAVTPEELASAKESYANSLVFGFTTASATVSRLMQLEYEGLPQDFYQTFLAQVQAVTAQDVARVAREYLHPDRLSIFIVGNPDKFDGKLDLFGPVQEIRLQTVE